MIEIVRHKARGTFYDVLGEAEVQLAKPAVTNIARPYSLISEGDRLVVYVGDDGKMYLRFPEEFHDGRFELSAERGTGFSFQGRAWKWVETCFGEAIASDRIERNHRFLEEALEVVQAAGCTASEAHQLVDYVFGRATGELRQEIGSALLCLALLASAAGVSMQGCGDAELRRVWTLIDKIKAKQAAKPKHSPLPE